MMTTSASLSQRADRPSAFAASTPNPVRAAAPAPVAVVLMKSRREKPFSSRLTFFISLIPVCDFHLFLAQDDMPGGNLCQSQICMSPHGRRLRGDWIHHDA